MASRHVFATVGTTKFDLFISTLSCQKVLRVSEHHPLQLIIKADTLKISLHSAPNARDSVWYGNFPIEYSHSLNDYHNAILTRNGNAR